MLYQDLICTVEEGIAIITLNRPDSMNSLTIQTHEELARAVEEARADEAVVATATSCSPRLQALLMARTPTTSIAASIH